TSSLFRHHADSRSCANDLASGAVERLHDLRLVWPSEESRVQALADRRTGELGHRLVRIPAASAGQSHRLHGDEPGAAKDPAGSDYPLRVRAVCDALHERTLQAGLRVGRLVPAGRGLFHIQIMSLDKYRYIVVEGPIGVGKTTLAQRIAERIG